MFKINRKFNNIFLFALLILYFSTMCESKQNNSLRPNTAITVDPQAEVQVNQVKPLTSTVKDIGSNNEFFDNEKNKFFYRRYIKCTTFTCQSPNTCLDASTCKCGQGYADLGRNTDIYCTHDQRKQSTALFLELFFPFGVGHFYCGRILIGFIKFVWYLIPAIMICYIFLKNLKFKSGGNDNRCFLFTVMTLCYGLSIWQLVDLIKFGMNKYKDGWGVPLQPFM
jgi:hypothetical protein